MMAVALGAMLVCTGPVANQRCTPASAGLVTPDAHVPGSVELRIYARPERGGMRLKPPLRTGPCTPVMR